MRNKKSKYKYKNMYDESLRLGNLREESEYNCKKSEIFIEIIMIFIFSFFMILSFLGLYKLIKYQYIFTIYRYINHTFSSYFPIQLSSYSLILMFFFIILIITISCVFFIIKLLINLLKKRRNEIFKGNPIIISIPLILNSILFLLGIVLKKYKEIQNFYYLGLIVALISFFILLKINFDKKNKKNIFKINYESEFMKAVFEDILFNTLLGINLYYCYYVIFQIVYYLSDYNVEILNFSGIVINFSMGLVSLYINLKLKSISFNIMYMIIYLGIFIFQITIRKEERDEFKVGYGESILCVVFFFCFFLEFIFISCLQVEENE